MREQNISQNRRRQDSIIIKLFTLKLQQIKVCQIVQDPDKDQTSPIC